MSGYQYNAAIVTGGLPTTTNEELLQKTGIQHDSVHLGQLAPAVGTSVLVPQGSAVAGQSRDNGLIPGLSVNAEFLLPLANDNVDWPDAVQPDAANGNFSCSVIGYAGPAASSAAIWNKRGGAGNPGLQLKWGAAGMVTATASDGSTTSDATVVDGPNAANVADLRRHVLHLAVLRGDTGGGARPNGTLYACTEQGISPPVELPAGSLTAAGIVASLGQSNGVVGTTQPGLRVSHILIASGPNLSAMAAGGAEAVQDYCVSLHQLLVNQQQKDDLRMTWFAPSVTGTLNPATGSIAVTGTPQLVDNFINQPEPLTSDFMTYTGGVLGFGKSPGMFLTSASWECTLSGSATVTADQRLGFLIGQVGEITIKVISRNFVTSGVNNRGDFNFHVQDQLPPVKDGLAPEIGPFFSATNNRNLDIVASDAFMASRGLSPPG